MKQLGIGKLTKHVLELTDEEPRMPPARVAECVRATLRALGEYLKAEMNGSNTDREASVLRMCRGRANYCAPKWWK